MGGNIAETVPGVYLATLVLLVGCTACGTEPTYVTRHGLLVYDDAELTSQWELEQLTQRVYDATDAPATRLEGLEVSFQPLVLHPTQGYVGGYAMVEGVKVALTEPECLAHTHYLHELLHVIYYHKWGRHNRCVWADIDSDHTKWVGQATRDIRPGAVAFFCSEEQQ